MNELEMWNAFIKQNKEVENEDYSAWCYGNNSHELAMLTYQGIKTATSSLYDFYKIDNELIPMQGDYSIILDEDENTAICIVKTTKVSIVSFDNVSEEHAYKEGEGDRSLKYWKKMHKLFFEEETMGTNIKFNSNSMVVLEEFEVVFK